MLFKQLLEEFFVEFLDLFVPDALHLLDTNTPTLLDKEVFRDLLDLDRREADLVVQARFRNQPTTFIVHLEHQAQEDKVLHQRMFRYFARFHDRYAAPVYPIALCSYRTPQQPAPDRYAVGFPEFAVLEFRFRVVQLNQLRWRDDLRHPNPLATALLTRMRVAPHERRAVKAACLAHLVGLPISAKRRRIISQFLDVYLPLAPADEAEMYAAHPEIAPSQPEVPADLSACQGVLTWLSAHLSVLVHACNVCDVASYLIEFTQENLSAPPRITTSARPGSVGAGLAAPAGSVGCAQPVQYAGRLPICIGSDTDANPRDLARDQRLVRRLGGVGYPWAH